LVYSVLMARRCAA